MPAAMGFWPALGKPARLEALALCPDSDTEIDRQAHNMIVQARVKPIQALFWLTDGTPEDARSGLYAICQCFPAVAGGASCVGMLLPGSQR